MVVRGAHLTSMPASPLALRASLEAPPDAPSHVRLVRAAKQLACLVEHLNGARSSICLAHQRCDCYRTSATHLSNLSFGANAKGNKRHMGQCYRLGNWVRGTPKAGRFVVMP